MQRRFRTAHARIWTVLAVLLPLALIVALAMRQTRPVDRPAVLVEPPAAAAGSEQQ